MNVLLIMIPLSLLLLAGAALAFFWAVDHDQFADLETPGLLPLDDDPTAVPESYRGAVDPDADDHAAPRVGTTPVAAEPPERPPMRYRLPG